jgi:hypothetical protein
MYRFRGIGPVKAREKQGEGRKKRKKRASETKSRS